MSAESRFLKVFLRQFRHRCFLCRSIFVLAGSFENRPGSLFRKVAQLATVVALFDSWFGFFRLATVLLFVIPVQAIQTGLAASLPRTLSVSRPIAPPRLGSFICFSCVVSHLAITWTHLSLDYFDFDP